MSECSFYIAFSKGGKDKEMLMLPGHFINMYNAAKISYFCPLNELCRINL